MDREGQVKSQVQQSLDEIGRTHPNMLLATARDFLRNNTGADKAHRIFTLQLIERCLSTHRDQIAEALGLSLVELGIAEMTASKSVVMDWQGAASRVLASLCLRFPTPIVEQLFALFPPGQIPHYFLIKTLADVSMSNPMEVVPRLKDILARLLPILSSVKTEDIKFVIVFALTQWCEAILCYLANLDQASDKTISIQSFSSEMFPAYEILFNNWLLNSKDAQTRLQIVRALGNICALLPTQQFEGLLPKLIPVILKRYSVEKDPYPITQALSNVLCVAIASEERHRTMEQNITLHGSEGAEGEFPSDHILHSDVVEGGAAPETRTTYVPTRVPVLEPLLGTILSTIAPLSAKPVNPNDPSDARNHNELLRCYEVIGRVYSDTLVSFLLGRLEISQKKDKGGGPTVRASALVILRHLITRLDPQLEDKKGLLVSGLKPLALHETDYFVKKNIAQVIISMGDHCYLQLDGGESLIEFLLRGSSLSDQEIQAFNAAQKSPVPSDRTPDGFRNLCDRILHLLTTTIPQTEVVLWPYLFEHFVHPKFKESLAIAAKCATIIGNKKRIEWQNRLALLAPGDPPPPEDFASDAYLIDFDRAVNVPKAPGLVMRMLVMANAPHRRNQLGQHTLGCLHAIGPIVHPDLPQLWDHAVPKLIGYLEAKSQDLTNWNAGTWEDLILRLLAESIKAVQNDDWTLSLGAELSAQFGGYFGEHTLKKVAFKQMGLILQKLNHKEFIKAQLSEIFLHCDHRDETERQGCAQAFGYCAATHLDMTLEKVQELLKAKPPKKEGFFGLFSSSSKEEVRVPGATIEEKKTALLSFGYVSAYASTKLVTSRIEINMLSTMKPFLENPKSIDVKDVLIKTIDLIGKAVHPSHLKANYVLKDRDVLVQHIIRYISLPAKGNKDDPPFKPPVPDSGPILDMVALRTSGLGTLTTLIHLQPALPRPLEAELVKAIIAFVSLPPPQKKSADPKKKPAEPPAKPSPAASSSSSSAAASSSSSSSSAASSSSASSSEGGEEVEAPVELAVEVEPAAAEPEMKRLSALFIHLTEALSVILYMDPTIECLCRLLGSLDPWTRTKLDFQRERATTIVHALLKKFVELKSKGVSPPPGTLDDKFLHLGPVLSMLIPRTTDSSARVRVRAMEAIQTVLYIDHILRRNARTPPDGVYDLQPPQALIPMTELRARISQPELTTQFAAVFEVADVLCELVLDVDEMANMLLKVLSALNDPELTSAAGTCVALNAMLKLRGHQLQKSVPELITGMLQAMAGISEEKTMNGTLHSLRTLASHHLLDVLQVLIDTPLPHSIHVAKSLQVIAQDEGLLPRVMDYICDILNNSQVLIDNGGGKITPSAQSLSITCGLNEILQISDVDDYVAQHIQQLFGTLILRLGTTASTGPKPREHCVAAWKNFVQRVKSPTLKAEMENGARWIQLQATDDYLPIVSLIARCIARDFQPQLPSLYDYIAPYVKGNFIGQRIVTVAVLSEFVSFAKDNSILLQRLINSILMSLTDPKLLLSAIKGLGNLADCGPDEANKYAQTVVNSLMTHVDSKEHELAMQAMSGLSRLFCVVNAQCVTPILINVVQRIQPAFEGQDAIIRAAAFRLFGTLARFGSDVVSLELLVEQIHIHLPSMIMHLNESDPKVRDSCKYALKQLVPLLRNPQLDAWVAQAWFEEGVPLPYESVLQQLASGLVGFPERTNYYIMTLRENYWHSKRGSLLCTNAVLVVGHVLAALPVDARRPINMDILSGALIRMFQQEKKMETRKAVAFVIALLIDY